MWEINPYSQFWIIEKKRNVSRIFSDLFFLDFRSFALLVKLIMQQFSLVFDVSKDMIPGLKFSSLQSFFILKVSKIKHYTLYQNKEKNQYFVGLIKLDFNKTMEGF